MTFKFLGAKIPNTHAESIFEIKSFLTGEPGWTVVSSGDGISNYDATGGSAITSAGVGAKGLNNNNAWFIIKSPSGISDKYLCFQRKSGDGSGWVIRYSKTGFTVGTATHSVAPTAALNPSNSVLNESTLFDGTLFNVSAGSYVLNGAADDVNDHGFYFFCHVSGKLTSGACTMLIHDPISFSSLAVGDEDPRVFYVNGNTLANINSSTDGILFGGRLYQSGSTSGKNTFKGYVCYNKSNPQQTFANITVSSFGRVDSATGNYAPNNQGNSAYSSSAEEVLPVYYFHVNQPGSPNSRDSFKGGSSLMLMGNPVTRKTGDLLNLSYNGDKIFVNGFIFPWDGSTVVN